MTDEIDTSTEYPEYPDDYPPFCPNCGGPGVYEYHCEQQVIHDRDCGAIVGKPTSDVQPKFAAHSQGYILDTETHEVLSTVEWMNTDE